MNKDELLQKYPEIADILKNIKKNQEIIDNDLTPGIIGLITGSEENRKYLEKRFQRSNIFKSSKIFSTHEEMRKSNFLGTLLFYNKLKRTFLDIKDDVILCGMVFGKGERISPITHALRNMKPIIPIAKTIKIKDRLEQEILIETALRYFSLVSHYLKERGFKGILDKWGDEIQIPGIDLFSNHEDLTDCDLIKVVSEQIVNPQNSKEKDWVSYDDKNNLLRQIPRRPIEEFDKLFDSGLVRKNEKGEYICGVSLGPVAVSYRLLDLACEIFKEEIDKKGVYFDFDPYLIMALALTQSKDGKIFFENERDKKIDELDNMIIKNQYGNNFYDKVKYLKEEFERRYNKKLIMKVLNFGKVYWGDFGQHKAMREYFMGLKEESREGYISRLIAGIPEEKDEFGNRIVDSIIGDVYIRDSVIVNSRIEKGIIIDSVVINGIYYKAELTNSFSVGDKAYSIKINKHSGSINTLCLDHITVPENHRHVSVALKDGVKHFIIDEDNDLRCELNMNHPVCLNDRSFRSLYKDVEDITTEESEEITFSIEGQLIEKIKLTKTKGSNF